MYLDLPLLSTCTGGFYTTFERRKYQVKYQENSLPDPAMLSYFSPDLVDLQMVVNMNDRNFRAGMGIIL